MINHRLMLKGLRKRHNGAKTKSDSEIETLTTSGSERGANVEVVAGVEAIEEAIVISVGVRHEIRGHHLQDAEAHHLASVVLLPHVRLIHTFRLAKVVANQMIGAAGRLLLEGRLPTRDPGQEVHRAEDTKIRILQDSVVDTVPVGLEPPYAGIMAGIGIIEFEDVVITEQDPIHLQILLAHDRPEEVEEDDPPPYHLVAPHRLQEPDTILINGIRLLHRALAQ